MNRQPSRLQRALHLTMAPPLLRRPQRRHTLPLVTRVFTVVITLLLISLFIASTCAVAAMSAAAAADAAVQSPNFYEAGRDTVDATEELDVAAPVVLSASHGPPQQTTALAGLWWRTLEEQDTFVDAFFGRPLATASIGAATVTGTLPQSEGLKEGSRHAPPHGAPGAPQLLPQQPFPKLHMLFAVPRSSGAPQPAAGSAPSRASLAAAESAYAHLWRSVLPQAAPGTPPASTRPTGPITELEAAARTSPIAKLRSRIMGGLKGTPQSTHETATPTAASTRLASLTAHMERMVRTVADVATAGAAASTPAAAAPGGDRVVHDAQADVDGWYPTENFVDERIIYTNGSGKAFIPVEINTSGNTIIRFPGLAGNTINAVVQVRDSRYDSTVSVRNCYFFDIQVQLRSKYTPSTYAESSTAAAATATPVASVQAREYVRVAAWQRGAEVLGDDSDDDGGTSNWGAFWDSFAQIFDNSALCKVLRSVGMRVKEAPVTEPYYVILRATKLMYTYQENDGNTCKLEVFLEQEPAARLKWLQFVFSFLLPLLVLLVPLPFTMRRADLVQQYMMDSDFAEWVWLPPLLIRKKMVDGIKAGMEWALSLRTAYQQRALRQQLLQQQQQQQPSHDVTVEGVAHPQPQPQTEVRRSGWGCASAAAATPLRQPPAATAAAPPAVGEVRAAGAASSAPDSPSHPRSSALSEEQQQQQQQQPRHSRDVLRTPPSRPRRQFREVDAGSTPASSVTSRLSPSSGASTGSDSDEVSVTDSPDARRRRRQARYEDGSEHTHTHHQHRRARCSTCEVVAATTPPSSAPTSESTRAHSHGAERCSPRRHRDADIHGHHQRQQSTASQDDAAHAISVHVPPPLTGTPAAAPAAAGEAGEGVHYALQRGTRLHDHRRDTASHDLLFTTEEVAGETQRCLATAASVQTGAPASAAGAHEPTSAVAQSREEKEALAKCGAIADGVLVAKPDPGHGTHAAPPLAATCAAPAAAAAGAAPPLVQSFGDAKPSAAAPGQGHEEEEQEPFCRICREGNDVAPLITPCACTGSVRFVHATCLDRWRIESAKRNLANVNRCEICKEPFRVNIQRSMLVWESTQHILSGVCLFLTCLIMIGATTTATYVVLGEMSCLASYHQVSYSTMFHFEGLSLTFFVYCLAVLLVLLANLIVFSWFRSRPDVAEYIDEMHIIPPFYTRRNNILIVIVCIVLLAQVHATGYLLKYFLYSTSNLVWNWETSPLMGGMLFALFTTLTITFCSWGRQMYFQHVVRGGVAGTATDVVVEPVPEATPAAPAAPVADATPAEAPLSASVTANAAQGRGEAAAASSAATTDAPQSPSAPPPAPAEGQDDAAAAGAPGEDLQYTRHFEVPPEQRVIRAFEYCPPRRKLPKW